MCNLLAFNRQQLSLARLHLIDEITRGSVMTDYWLSPAPSSIGAYDDPVSYHLRQCENVRPGNEQIFQPAQS
jgi:hypothetical protein